MEIYSDLQRVSRSSIFSLYQQRLSYSPFGTIATSLAKVSEIWYLGADFWSAWSDFRKSPDLWLSIFHLSYFLEILGILMLNSFFLPILRVGKKFSATEWTVPCATIRCPGLIILGFTVFLSAGSSQISAQNFCAREDGLSNCLRW